MARPSDYTPDIADTICERIALGDSVRTITQSDDMPSERTVYVWLQKNIDFQQQYARARASQAERMLDEIIQIADDVSQDTEYGDAGPKANAEWINRSRLRVDARKWAMSKLAPKKYGDKLDLTSDGEKIAGPAVFQVIPASQRPVDPATE